MKHIILYGHLAKKFGRHHYFHIRTTGEAISALMANFPDFRSHIMENPYAGYHVRVGREYRGADELGLPADDTIKIVPAVTGSGGDFGKIILGVALIALTVALPGLSAPLLSGMWGKIAFSVGFSLVMGGISSLLASPPENSADEQKSTSISGNNSSAAGSAVPIVYGRLMVGSVQVGTSLETVDILEEKKPVVDEATLNPIDTVGSEFGGSSSGNGMSGSMGNSPGGTATNGSAGGGFGGSADGESSYA